MKRVVVLSVIFIQLLIFFALIFNLYQKKSRLLEVVRSNSVSKEDVDFYPSGNLKYFYEPHANSVIADDYLGRGKGHSINSDSLAETVNYNVKKSDGVFRIITLGDSITYGLHVDTKDNWTELLEDKLNSEMKCSNIKKFEVINLAVWGYDNEYNVERFRIRGQKYNPDLVIWYQTNMMQLDDEINKIVEGYMKTAVKDPHYKSEDYRSVRYDYWLKAAGETSKKFTREYVFERQKKAIESLGNYYKGNLLFVEFPEMASSDKDFLHQLASKKSNYYLLDSTSDYVKMSGAVDSTHPNKKGHQIIAEDIYNYLLKNNLISCN